MEKLRQSFPGAADSRLAALAVAVGATMPEARQQCRLAPSLVNGIIEQGLFRLWIPRRFGGLELPLPATLEIYESAARIDGSLGWAIMIGAGGGLFAAFLPADTAESLFRPRDAVVAGSGAPGGVAEKVAGGYQIRGRWRYASGADYATIFTANCRVLEQGQQVLVAGRPLIRAMAFLPRDVTIHRTWNTTGLRATGSHDIEVIDAFVPDNATFSVVTDSPHEAGPLYRIPFTTLTELPVSALVLGIAEHALEEFTALATSKPAIGTGRVLSEMEPVRSVIKSVRSQIDDARQILHQQANRIWDGVQAGTQLDSCTVRMCSAASVRAVRGLVTAIAELVPLAGMNAIAIDDPFSVVWRDMEAAAAHYSVSPALIS